MNYLNIFAEMNTGYASFREKQNLENIERLKTQIDLQTGVFKTSLLDQTVAPSLDPSISLFNTLTFTSIAKCFDKAYTEVISSKNWTVILASYQSQESIFACLPKELIDSIFQIDRQISHFDKYNARLASQGTAPKYYQQIETSRFSHILILSPSDAQIKQKKQDEQDKCFL